MRANTQKITKEFCKTRILLFAPATIEEAVFIQHKILQMGFSWGDGTHGIQEEEKCVSTGMVLSHGELYHSPSFESYKNGFLCTSAQFDEAYIPSELAYMREQFNKLSEKVDQVYAELHPKQIDKPVFRLKK